MTGRMVQQDDGIMDMSRPQQLRTLLAELYSRETDVRRIVGDAGLDAARITFDGKVINIWTSVLEEAEKQEKLDVLVEVVREEVPAKREELTSALAAYRRRGSRGSRMDGLKPGRFSRLPFLGSAIVAALIIIAVLVSLWMRPDDGQVCGGAQASVFHYMSQAREYRDEGEYDCARQNFEAGLKIATSQSERAELYYGLSTVAIAQSDSDAAESAHEFAQEGLKHDPNMALLYLSDGLALCRLQRWSEAFEQVKKYMELREDESFYPEEVDALRDDLEAQHDVQDVCIGLALGLP